MPKIIIDIKDDISPELALKLVARVVNIGKISHDTKGRSYYCWATLFDTLQGDIAISTRPYRKNDCFIVQKHREYEKN